MNEPTQQQAEMPDGTTLDQRVAILHEQFGTESSETADEAALPSPPDPPAAATSAASDDTDDAAAKARAERRARLDALNASERARVDRKAKFAEQDRIARELEAERQRARDLEQRMASLVDVEQLDEAKFFEVARRSKVTPDRLAEWIRESTANPEMVAAHVAKRELDPKVAALEAKLAAQEARFAQYLEQQQRAQAMAEERAVEARFVEGITSDAAPYSAKFIESFGAGEFLKVARSAGATLPEGAGSQALIDVIEEHLEQFARAYASAGEATPSKKPAPQKAAAAKATNTVSNSLAQERASVVDEEDWSSLSFEDRVARLRGTAR